jgi:conjugative transfer signal peptidase TraF
LKAGVVLLAVCLAWAVDAQGNLPGPRINSSLSLPYGLYWFRPIGVARVGVRVGDIVLACLPAGARAVSDLGDGSCPSGIEPAAKILAATAPSTVTFATDGVRIDGAKPWPMSRPIAAGHPVSGTIILAPGKMLLMGLHPYSYDSRYFGSIDSRAIIGTWRPLWTF